MRGSGRDAISLPLLRHNSLDLRAGWDNSISVEVLKLFLARIGYWWSQICWVFSSVFAQCEFGQCCLSLLGIDSRVDMSTVIVPVIKGCNRTALSQYSCDTISQGRDHYGRGETAWAVIKVKAVRLSDRNLRVLWLKIWTSCWGGHKQRCR
jgi:hypothetical protein